MIKVQRYVIASAYTVLCCCYTWRFDQFTGKRPRNRQQVRKTVQKMNQRAPRIALKQ
jgi:hypothetical protein